MSTASPSGPRDPQAEESHAPRDGSDGPSAPSRRRARLVFDDPLDQRSADDSDDGWGERPAVNGGAADLARFLDEKPPHHI